MKPKTFRALAFAVTLLPAAARAGEHLTLQACVAQALQNHPSLTAAAGTVESNRARTSQAAVSSRLRADGSAGYTRSGVPKGFGTDGGDWSSGVTLSQTVTDWGKTSTAIKSARLSEQASSENYRRTREEVVAAVRDAYYGLNKSVRDVAVQKEQVKNYEKRLEWAKSYYSVGTKAKIEVTKAETDLANARLSLIKAESSAEQYKAQLASAMGLPALDIEDAEDELEFQPWKITLGEALERAAAHRSDLTAQDLLVAKAKIDVKSAALNNTPDLVASGGYTFGGESFDDTERWNARLSLVVPIGDGGMTKALTAQSRAALKIAQANREQTAQDIVLEVRRAWQSLRESAASIGAARMAVRQARENLELALGRYRAGVGDSLEISDAVDKYAGAQTTLISCLYDHQEARLSLEEAMGEVSGS